MLAAEVERPDGLLDRDPLAVEVEHFLRPALDAEGDGLEAAALHLRDQRGRDLVDARLADPAGVGEPRRGELALELDEVLDTAEHHRVVLEEELLVAEGLRDARHLPRDAPLAALADLVPVHLVQHGLAEEALVRAAARGHHADELEAVAEVLLVVDERPVGVGKDVEVRLELPRRPEGDPIALLRGQPSHLVERRAALEGAGELDDRVLALADRGRVEAAQHGLLRPQGGVRAADHDREVGALRLDAVEHPAGPLEEHGARAQADEVGVGQGLVEPLDGVHRQVEEADRVAARPEHGAEVQEAERLLKLPEGRIVPARVDQYDVHRFPCPSRLSLRSFRVCS